MDRRTLLRTVGAALACASIPGWNEVFAQAADDKAAKRPSLLRATFDVARVRGRPLLVLLGPPARGVESDRARRWSLYLQNASELALADLALCEIACAFQDDFAREFPDAAKDLRPDVMGVLLETEGAAFTRVHPPITFPVPRDIEWEDEAPSITKHNVEVERALRQAITPDRATIERRIAQSRRALREHELIALGGPFDEHAEPKRMHARLVPAWVLLRAVDDPEKTLERCTLLAEEARERWRTAPPPGARWARRGSGCMADTLEGDGPRIDQVSFACGMAHIPEHSKRFLWFYAESDRDAFESPTKR